jgi:shikimate kinase
MEVRYSAEHSDKARMKKNIYLIGFMGSGKTTVGRLLAKTLELPFIDTDSIIEEEEGVPIPEIFGEQGERYFRAKEGQVLRKLTKQYSSSGFVMSTGGGMPCNPRNIRYMREHGTVVYLKTGVDEILARVNEPMERPVLHRLEKEGDPKEAIRSLLEKREHYYSKADITVTSSKDLTAQIVTDTIVTGLEG